MARLSLLPLLVAGAAAAAPVPRPTPAAMAGEIRLYRRSVSLTREAVLNLAPGADRDERQASATAVLELELRSRTPEALDGVLRGVVPARFTVRDQQNRLLPSARAEVVGDEELPVLRITAEGLPSSLRILSSVEGSLPVFAQARRIRFHVPWLKDEVPLSSEVYGGKATLKRFQLVGGDSTLWVTVQPPPGFRVAPLNQPGSLTARAMDIDGNLVNGGGITEIAQTGSGPEPEFRFLAPGLRRTPSRLMLDVLCVSGEPRPLPFRLGPVRLP